MHRRVKTLVVVLSAVSLLIGIGIPAATAASHRDRGGWRHRHWVYPRGRHHFSKLHHRRPHSTLPSEPTTTTRPTATTEPTTTTGSTTTTSTTGVANPGPVSPPANSGGGGGDAKPAAGGYFSILPPGSALPSGAACAARVHGSTWEPHPENNTANHTAPTNPGALANFSQWSSAWNASYKPRIDGNFQGTTDEIIQWAACKWGWSDEVIRAEAVVESTWRQSTAGDGGNSFGLLQIKWNYHPAGPAKGAAGSSWPNSAKSTAYAVDQQVAEMRGCYDGMSTYLGNTRGDLWGCLQSWFSGSWTAGGGSYANNVKNVMAAKPWLNWAG